LEAETPNAMAIAMVFRRSGARALEELLPFEEE
jgi:hypothetical protein